MAHPGGVIVPFIGMIPGGMLPGKKISIHGMVIPACNRFSVNLQCGPNVNPRDDIALHMNFRYDQQVPYVVRNSLQMQQWGIEEGHGYLSFARGQNFEIQIHAEHDHFKIHFNGNHFTDFRYRLPLQRVTYISIDGEVVLHGVKIDGYPIAAHGMHQPGMHQPGMPPPVHGMGMPAIAAPMYPGYPTGVPMHSSAIPVVAGVGAGMAMGHAAGMHMDKKMMKKQKKAMKKAMKHNKHSHHGMQGYPHHGHGHGHHKGSSSSSSSSSEEE